MEDPMDEIVDEVMVTGTERRAAEVCRATITAKAARTLLEAGFDPADLARSYSEACRLRERPCLVVPLGGAAVIADWDIDQDCLAISHRDERR